MPKKNKRRPPAAKSRVREEPAPLGRPSDYTEAGADDIVSWLGDGKSLRSYCKQPGKPSKMAVMRWLAKNEDFQRRYAIAREAQADALVDEALDIADDGSADYIEVVARDGSKDGTVRLNNEAVARSKLRVDARIKLAAMLAPKKYGDKLHLNVDDRRPMTPQARRARIAELWAMGAGKKPKADGDHD